MAEELYKLITSKVVVGVVFKMATRDRYLFTASSQESARVAPGPITNPRYFALEAILKSFHSGTNSVRAARIESRRSQLCRR